MAQGIQNESNGTRRGIGRLMGRRGIMAAAVASAAVGLGRLSGASRVEAAAGDPLVISASNTTAGGSTRLVKTGGSAETAVFVSNTNSDGIQAISDVTIGVNALGVSQGVLGASTSSGGVGVLGVVFNQALGQGVLGNCVSAIGVWGNSVTNIGVLASSGGSHAVFGSSSAGSAAGVLGTNTSASGTGVTGQNANGIAVQATSTTSAGLFATSGSGTAVIGRSTTGKAAEFFGAVEITGDFTATGMKSAAVRVADGSLRRMYCLESPVSYFEDLGEAALSSGAAAVRLDDMFVSTVDSSDYFVFLTPEGECQGLFVETKTPRGFVVRELNGGNSNVKFSYRVVAKRAGIENDRFAPVRFSGDGTPASGPQPTRIREVQVPAAPAAPRTPSR